MSPSRRVTANTATFTAPLDDIAAAARAAGFDGLEIWAHDIEAYQGGSGGVESLLDRSGCALSALQVLRDVEGAPDDQRAARFAEAEAMLDMTAKVGADTLLVCANVSPDSSGDQHAQVRDLRALAEMAAARHIRIGFEPLAWSRWLNRYETAWACVEAVDHPAVGLTVDCFHLFHQGTPAAFIDTIPLEKIFLVQLCDAADLNLPARDLARHHRLFPGAGSWPVAELARRMEARGYGGFYNIEIFNDAYKLQAPELLAQQAFDAFQSLF